MKHIASPTVRGNLCAAVAAVVAISVIFALPGLGQQFSPWSEARNLGTSVNSTSNDRCPFVTKNGLTLYFASNRIGSAGFDIYVSHRDSVDDPWDTPVKLGPEINGSGDETAPMVTVDGHRMYFTSTSDRPGKCGMADLYVSWRTNKYDDTAWETPQNLGCVVNSAANDFNPTLFENEAGRSVLYFSSDRAGTPGSNDIYSSEADENGQFGVALAVTELNTTANDQQPSIRKDGLEIFFASNRPGSSGMDIWTSTREDDALPWSPPVRLEAPVNTAATEARPWLSFNGENLYFVSNRTPRGAGGLDLWVVERAKANPGD